MLEVLAETPPPGEAPPLPLPVACLRQSLFRWPYSTQPSACSVSSWHSPCVYVSISSSNVDTSHDNFRAQASPLWPPSYGVLHLPNTSSKWGQVQRYQRPEETSRNFLNHLSEWAQHTENRLSFSSSVNLAMLRPSGPHITPVVNGWRFWSLAIDIVIRKQTKHGML